MDLIELLGERITPAVRTILEDTYRAQVSALSSLQSDNGLWHTVLDFPGSYEETSGSAGFVYGILKGIRFGVLGEEYRIVAEKGIDGILASIDKDGTVLGVSAGTPVGYSRAHYEGIMIAPMAYGQSLPMLALSEALKEI